MNKQDKPRRKQRQHFEPGPLLPPGIYGVQVYDVQPFVRSSSGRSIIHKITFIVNRKGRFYGFKARAFPVLRLLGPDGDYERGEASVVTEGRELIKQITSACGCQDIQEIGGKKCLVQVINEVIDFEDHSSPMALVRSAGTRIREDAGFCI